MNRRATPALLALVALVVVSGACRKKEPPPVGLRPTSTGPLVFPPPLEGWTARAPLAKDDAKGDPKAVRLSSPSIDADGWIEVSGQEVRLHFDETLVEDLKKAPRLTIAPAVSGKTVWPYGGSVEFHADAPLDPSTEYTLSLPDLTTPSGRTLKDFRVRFRPKLALEVSGKTLTYVPEKGKPRVLATVPLGDQPIGGAQEIDVVFDQPVALDLARKLVTLEDPAGKPIASTISHLAGGTFEGQKVDPRMIVVVRPVRPLSPGTELVLRAKSQKEGEEEQTRKLAVAKPTVLDSLSCREGSNCEANGTKVLGSAHADLLVKWSNPASRVMRTENVRVTPLVKNLWVYGWSDTATIAGAFEPSKTYSIQIGGGRDDYGGPVAPLTITFETRPLPASLTMAEGPLLANDAALRAIPVTARNVERAEMRLWALPPGDVEAFTRALRDARAGTVPSGEPSAVVSFTPTGKRDAFADVTVDVSAKVERGRVYVAQLVATQLTPKAPSPDTKRDKYAAPNEGPNAVVSLLVAPAPGAVGAHVHQAGEKAIVQVFGLESGEPTPGAKVTVGGATATTTDATGAASIAVPRPAAGDEVVARIEAGAAVTFVPFGASHATTARALFPELATSRTTESEPAPPDMVGMIVTDRGVYRPGSKIALKGFVRRLETAGLRPVAGAKVRLHVLDGTEQVVVDDVVVTGEHGTFARDVAVDKAAKTGRWHVKLEIDGPQRLVLADEMVRVSSYEAPRFKVDVEPEKGAPPNHFRAKVMGRYLFGGAMAGANVSWSLRMSPASVNGGALGDAGLSFGDDGWFYDDIAKRDDKPVVGEGKLDEEGTLLVDATHGELSARSPTELVLEADVSDASNRHVAGVARAVEHTAPRYAGVRLARRFGGPGPLRVDLGVVDTKGEAVVGAKVGARLERLTFTRTAEKAESGALVEQWKDVSTVIGECEATSAAKPVSCDLVVPRNGSYRIVTRVDGRDGARTSFYAWGGEGEPGDAVPSEGKKVPLVLDKAKYEAGETAKVLVQSPFTAATALLTVEQGGLVRHETKRVDGPSATFDVPLASASTPWVHAVVTLLPIGSAEADWRVGVARIPVSNEGARLEVKVASGKPSYEVRDEAEITVEVKRNGAPVKDADVTLAVVDEGVLRLTNHHAKDPVAALHPGRELGFRVFDTRGWLVRRREKAHVAGGGESGDEDGATRRKFLETVAFLPDLVTDAKGRATVKVQLPDNLTELRMMAVVVDDAGAGGNAESSFVVTKPIMLDPVLPRFALRGDRFEAAAMVHNTTDAPIAAKVTVAGQLREVTVPAKGHTRVGVPIVAERSGTRPLLFAVEALGKVRDRVELPLRIEAPGLEEHPAVSGVFTDKQEVTLAVPADAVFEEGAAVSVKTGSALYPELGERLGYLLDYPHGCVEQTTSSMLPLVAAKTLLPWTGTAPLSDEEIDKRIRVGVERLATMTTASGGLAYWPGGQDPNTFGTAYALRALVGARELGIERPKLVDAIATFLVGQLDEGDRDTRVFVAESLAKAGKLPESAADSLWDLRRDLDVFGKASLALALGSLPKQDDRVRELLDDVEKAFDDKGELTKPHDERDWSTWGSWDRDRAQALLAFLRHRPGTKLAPLLATRLASGVEGYTTQSTAWSLLALSAYVGGKKPEGAVDVKLRLEGRILDTTRKLGGDNKEIRIPLKDLAGQKRTLILEGDGKTPSAFTIDAVYKRPLEAQDGRIARHAKKGASVHRVYTDPKGKPLDLAAVKAGQVVRVALRVEFPDELSSWRRSYVALTDRLPAGFEPVDPDLETVARVDDLGPEHPFHAGLHGWYGTASHVDLRDDRVQIYFDQSYGRYVFASYLARATTPGSFALPPAHSELMYEPGSDGYSDAAKVTIAP